MPDTLLATKTYIPAVRSKLVTRLRLIQRLNASLTQHDRLTLISAPAGYGKSTLLSEWLSLVDRPAAWLSLDAGDNDPFRFWSYFIAALQAVPALKQTGFGAPILASLQAHQPHAMQELLVEFVNALASLPKQTILVLDDLHTVTENQIHQDLTFLVDHLPQAANSLQLVVASRMDPPWPLARWRARQELTELRSADLRFSYDEVFQFLNQALEITLPSQDIAALAERTEGWIAGLQMAALSIQGRLRSADLGEVARFIESFTGSHRFILDYLLEEVISQQSAEMRDFLYATSIVDQFTAALGDTLLGRQDSQLMLEQVERANLFLIPMDDERHWYRYHHLFADLLRKRMKQTQPERAIELHQRASEWFAENNFLAEAINHALQAGDVARVNKFITGNVLAMVEYAELMHVLRYFEQIPEEQICSKPWLCVAYIWVKAYVDPARDFDQYLLKAMASVNAVEDAVERQHLTSHLDAVWAYVAWVKGKASLALKFTHAALESLPTEDWLTRAHLLNIQGLAMQHLGHIPSAIQSFKEAVAAGQRSGRPHASFQAYTNWAYAAILQGRLHQAHSLCQHVLNLADQAGLVSKGLPVLAYAYATMSMVELEWNQVESAVSLARQSVALAERWRQADTIHFSLTCLVEALQAAGDLEAAFSTNQRAIQLAASVSPWFYRISAYEEVLLSLAKDDLAAAGRWFTELTSLVEGQNMPGHYRIVEAALLNAQGRFADALTAINMPIGGMEINDSQIILMRLLPMQALALHGLGRESEALEVIERCLAYAEPEGYVRIFVDQGAPMLKLLQLAARRGIHTEYVHRLLPAFQTPQTAQQPAMPMTHAKGQVLLEPLSDRELQVLRLLDSALSSEEISRELYISTNTVRTHIKNIYSKLDVHGRIEAIQKAKELGLI